MHKKPTTSSTTPSRPAARAATSTTTQATQTEVRDALAGGAGARLAGSEERALRMRFGVSAPHTLVLERVGQDNPDSREKLLGIELELLRQFRERQATTHRPDPRSQAAVQPAASASAPAASANPRRSKIVQALQTKKPAK